MQTNRRNNKTHFLCILTPENHNPVNQLSAGTFIHQWNETVTDFHFNGFHGQK